MNMKLKGNLIILFCIIYMLISVFSVSAAQIKQDNINKKLYINGNAAKANKLITINARDDPAVYTYGKQSRKI